MDEPVIIYLGLIIFIIGFIGYTIGQSNCNCDKNPQNVGYWKTKYEEQQKENEILKTQILDILVNAYSKKIIWSISGLSQYKIICYTDYSNLNLPEDLNNILDNLCKTKSN